jgi:replicative DNA helicase
VVEITMTGEIGVYQDRALVDGATFILDQPVTLVARWGQKDDVLWAHEESLMLVGPTGVGKTTLAGQLVGGLLGLLPDVLGWPVLPARKILYLAMDRPRQIQRALQRLFGEAHRAELAARLVIRRGPLPFDLGRNPELLLQLALDVGADVIIIDSLKDAATRLSEDSTGGSVNRAIQLCNAEGVDVLMLHHQRKGQDGRKPMTLEDVYGNSQITNGAGSIVLLWGDAGSILVELSHLKPPAEMLGPFMIEHDHHAGISKIVTGWDPLSWLTLQGPAGATISEAAVAHHGVKVAPGSAKWKQTERRLLKLVGDRLASKIPQGPVGSQARFVGVVAQVLQPRFPVDTSRGHERLFPLVDQAVDNSRTPEDTE